MTTLMVRHDRAMAMVVDEASSLKTIAVNQLLLENVDGIAVYYATLGYRHDLIELINTFGGAKLRALVLSIIDNALFLMRTDDTGCRSKIKVTNMLKRSKCTMLASVCDRLDCLDNNYIIADVESSKTGASVRLDDGVLSVDIYVVPIDLRLTGGMALIYSVIASYFEINKKTLISVCDADATIYDAVIMFPFLPVKIVIEPAMSDKYLIQIKKAKDLGIKAIVAIDDVSTTISKNTMINVAHRSDIWLSFFGLSSTPHTKTIHQNDFNFELGDLLRVV